jgi:alpha-tubulin suppressor-like RCC1 family protein
MTIIFGPGVSLGAGVQALAEPPTYLWAWGYNINGDLGLGNTANRSSPVQVGALGTWSQVSKGYNANGVQAVKTDGTLWAWGSNNQGQLGLGDADSRSSPVQVGALTNWAGSLTSAFSWGGATNFLKSNGTAWMCGYLNGVFNYPAYTNRSSPVQVGSDKTWSMVGSGSNKSWFGVTTGGQLWSSAALNNDGFSGQGNTTNTSSPAQVGALTDWAGVYPAYRACIARKTDGTIWSWGKAYPASYTAFLGQNNATARSSPTQIGSLTAWAGIACPRKYVVAAVKTDGTMWTWGLNSSGQLGLGDTINRSSPVQVGALTNWTTSKIIAGSAAIKTDGSLWTWGNGGSGQLANGLAYPPPNLRSSPVQVGSLTTWTGIGARGAARFAIASHAT